eukprot:Phypoly_transcript_06028.p1 GENE.Phypoly_transcript_06028~~Phypoly_transcript_06028.p1  ORF type:complete len:283 (+),score=25.70 Phypoly_transcript_06028:988-1836(+)
MLILSGKTSVLMENLVIPFLQFGNGFFGEPANINATIVDTVYFMPSDGLAISGTIHLSANSQLTVFGNVSCDQVQIYGGTMEIEGGCWEAHSIDVEQSQTTQSTLVLKANSHLIAPNIYISPNSTLVSYGAIINGTLHNEGDFKIAQGSTIRGSFIQERIGTLEALELPDQSIPLLYVHNASIDGHFQFSLNMSEFDPHAKFIILKSESKIRGTFQQPYSLGTVPVNLKYTSTEVQLSFDVGTKNYWWLWILIGGSVMFVFVSIFSMCIFWKYGHRDGFRRL